MRSLRTTLRELGREAKWLLAGGAPAFVVGSDPSLGPGEIPVFVFHSIEPRIFERHLDFLCNNGYHTLTADEFHESLSGERAAPERSVLLTIDDGRSSVWTFGFPLLKKYGFRAVSFLIPGYISESDAAQPHLGDVWDGQLAASDLVNRDPDLMTWDQIRQLHDSSYLDFQSHTLHHHRVFSSPPVRGFLNGDRSAALYDLVLPLGYEEKAKQGIWDELWGIPVFTGHSLMSGRPRFLSDPGLADHCNRYVRERGGKDFFISRQWTRELKQVVEKWHSNGGGKGRMQSEEELQTEIMENLSAAKQLIEDRLPGKQVRHLCYPYGEGSGLAVELSVQAGYASNFWTAENGKQLNRAGADPYHCPRLKGDYIFRLPGNGRRSLLAIIRDKFIRRLSAVPVY